MTKAVIPYRGFNIVLNVYSNGSSECTVADREWNREVGYRTYIPSEGSSEHNIRNAKLFIDSRLRFHKELLESMVDLIEHEKRS